MPKYNWIARTRQKQSISSSAHSSLRKSRQLPQLKVPPQLPQLKVRPHFPACLDIEVTVHGIRKQLQKLNTNKATGPDGISPRILKEGEEQLAPMLACIFNSP